MLHNRSTWLSRARNWVHRKENEPAPGQWSRLYAFVAELHDDEPAAFPALRRLAGSPNQFVLLELRTSDLKRYSGREFIVFDARRCLYYRMPGAAPHGSGRVAPGTYHVRVHPLDDAREAFFEIEKANETGFTLVQQSRGEDALDHAGHVRLEARELDYSWIAGELTDLALRALRAHAARLDATPRTFSTRRRNALTQLALACPHDDRHLWNEAEALARKLYTGLHLGTSIREQPMISKYEDRLARTITRS